MLKEIKNGIQSNDRNTVTDNVTFKVLVQCEAVRMTATSPSKTICHSYLTFSTFLKVTECTVTTPVF
jgi:hypothetical protein